MELNLKEISLQDFKILEPRFKELEDGISEFTFPGIYLFRKKYQYKYGEIGNIFILEGKEGGKNFFSLPFKLPEKEILDKLFERYDYMKNGSERQAKILKEMGYFVIEDRDNFDYIYKREDLSTLKGRSLHKKRNLIKQFQRNYTYEARPLTKNFLNDALKVLELWARGRDDLGDYEYAKEALFLMEELKLCGIIYYVNKKPSAYILGEETQKGKTFILSFEKAIDDYKGLYQFINKSFVEILPPKYAFINMEQDLGIEKLRKAKLSYQPFGFIKKFIIKPMEKRDRDCIPYTFG